MTIEKIAAAVTQLFRSGNVEYDGVPKINIYLLRLVFLVTFLFVGVSSWSTLLNHSGAWKPLDAMAFCVWAAYATLSVLGLFHPLKMLPLVVFQIFYKLIWLFVVAYPLWSANALAGSEAEELTGAFIWVILPIVAVPWRFWVTHYMLAGKLSEKASSYSSVHQHR
jgi:hypothetical protein